MAELRKVFQQHIRNDKNELLPVVLKVLSEEEVEAVVEKVEEEVAETEAGRQRTAANPTGTQAGRSRARTQAGPCWLPSRLDWRASGSSSSRCSEVVEDSAQAASEVGGRSLESLGRQGRKAQTLFDQTPDYLQAMARSNRILAGGAGTITLEWFGLTPGAPAEEPRGA